MAATPTIYPWAPTQEEIARLVPSYTVGGYDDDSLNAGAGVGVFTDTTEPTATEVDEMIQAACDEIAGRVGVEIPDRCFTLANATAKWHVAADIEGTKRSSSPDDSGSAYRANILNYRNSLDSLVELARMPSAMRLK